jgi:hypothetical protein
MAVQDGIELVPGAGDLLVVGFSGPLDPYHPETGLFVDTAVSSRQTAASGLSLQRTEALSVSCVMYVLARATHKEARDFAYARLSDLDDALRANPRLSGACEQASLAGEHRLVNMDTSSGWAVALPFAVSVVASL